MFEFTIFASNLNENCHPIRLTSVFSLILKCAFQYGACVRQTLLLTIYHRHIVFISPSMHTANKNICLGCCVRFSSTAILSEYSVSIDWVQLSQMKSTERNNVKNHQRKMQGKHSSGKSIEIYRVNETMRSLELTVWNANICYILTFLHRWNEFHCPVQADWMCVIIDWPLRKKEKNGRKPRASTRTTYLQTNLSIIRYEKNVRVAFALLAAIEKSLIGT